MTFDARRLDRTVTILRFSEDIDKRGAAVATWAYVTRLRAAIVRTSTVDGDELGTTTIFHTRFTDVRPLDRVQLGADVFEVTAVRELGRRQGLELRTRAPRFREADQ